MLKQYYTAKNDLLYEMCKCVFIDITNIFVNMTDFSCHFNQKDTLRIPNECLCVILTDYFLLCSLNIQFSGINSLRSVKEFIFES